MICHKFDDNSAELVAEYLKNNKVVIIPTDTVYGFSAVASADSIQNAKNQDKIRIIKGRSEDKPFIHLISNSQDIFKYTNQQISSEILNFWPGPLTVIVANNLIITKQLRYVVQMMIGLEKLFLCVVLQFFLHL